MEYGVRFSMYVTWVPKKRQENKLGRSIWRNNDWEMSVWMKCQNFQFSKFNASKPN